MNRRPTTQQITISIIFSAALFVIALTWDDVAPIWRALVVGLAALVVLLFVFTRPRSPGTAPNPLVDIVEQVVADETRRPWNPTTLPWLPSGSGPKSLLLVPAADYHLAEMVPLAEELERRGLETRLAIGESPWSRTWQGLHWYQGVEMHQLPTPEQVAADISIVVAMKDTGSMTDWVTEARALGATVVGKVEGAQDFWDTDTPEQRLPYRNLDLVLCQGRFDVEAIGDRETEIVGSTRLERLFWAPPLAPRQPMAVINLNFVYGVRTADRDLWLDTAIAGCEQAGIPYVVSVHPAERTRLKTNRTTRVAAARLLPQATTLISRFSTLPFEAMARGVPFVYHNPHGESVQTFSDPLGAFAITDDASSLGSALKAASEPGHPAREKTRDFMERFLDIGEHRSEQRAAAAVERLLGGSGA